MLILAQFLFRTAFGLAAAMALTSPRQVTSGYFRNHSYVLLGTSVLAALAAWVLPGPSNAPAAIALAVVSYAASVAWLYERRREGRGLLAIVAVIALFCSLRAQPQLQCFGWVVSESESNSAVALRVLDPLTGGLLIGTTLAAMFLGHWYLNTPTMELAPLRRLVWLLLGCAAARGVVCGMGLALQIAAGPPPQWTFVALRWLAGLIGPVVLGIMALLTLKIPNTQSATGILYVAVIVVFLGELTSQLLSAHTVFPI